ncbi:AbrB/MazE/SpoVT family DNA-binding domain-containing protein [Geoglobus acetivorans]|uniref:AbrB/MazE/SpoVT family DNA-binding domain-containing protein n=1 Tax=Geoglobus acetivorans TaxID=565033 RepID=A0ABZ3H7P9_GEOAI|nr:AbrB/MazE/SpoVT family DNA-binding domain-containing protein [Geoglobus acetivorans]
MKVRVTRNYQITIPAEIRRKINLQLGEVVDVTYDDVTGEIRIKKVSEKRKTLKIGKKLAPDEIENLISMGMDESL